LNFFGFQKTTLIDYPGKLAATIFTGGCNLRCPFCHNKELVTELKNQTPIEWEDIYNYLIKRKNILKGVCITGGEPLLYGEELKEIIKDIHSLGMSVKIDTNGTLPSILKKIDADYIAMDIKTSLEKYSILGYTGNDNLIENIKESISYIINSKIEHEFRTTVVPYIVEKEDILKICSLIKNCNIYYLAQFRPFNTLDENYLSIHPYPLSILEEMKEIAIGNGIKCELRTNYAVTKQ